MSDELERPPRPDLGPTLSEAELEALLANTRPESGPLDTLRELPTPLRAGVFLAVSGGLLFGGLFAVQGLRPDLADSAGLATALALVSAAGAAWLPWALVSVARPNPDPSRRLAGSAVGLVAMVLLATLPVWPGMHVPDEMRPSVDWACGKWALFNGTAVLGLYLLLDRHGGRRLFATLAVTAAAVSLTFAIQTLHCPCIDLTHIVGTHALAGGLAGLVLAGITAARGGARL
ncbi:MAG: hypothetical protein EP330_17750 [Deltaproteobacteria bacterium]|nr:MAG: hypothetical protein EP330_17750 [Deltaproteobacteria bacterium]